MFDSRLFGTLRHSVVLFAFVSACGGGPPAKDPSSAVSDSTSVESAEPSSPSSSSDNVPPNESEPNADPGATEAVGGGGDFKRLDTHTAKTTHGVAKSTLKPTATDALLKFVVVDKGKEKPIEGIVVSLTGPTGTKYYTKPTDATGFADLLVPAGQKYEVVYVSLRGKDIAANLQVEDKERLTLKLTLRYKGYEGRPGEKAAPLVLEGVQFDTGKATIRAESFPRLDKIVEYMTHKPDARIEISGHTDNVGKKNKNKELSTKRAEACRAYLITKGIDGSRVLAVGYGDERPITTNDTADGRQKNRRIEAKEL